MVEPRSDAWGVGVIMHMLYLRFPLRAWVRNWWLQGAGPAFVQRLACSANPCAGCAAEIDESIMKAMNHLLTVREQRWSLEQLREWAEEDLSTPSDWLAPDVETTEPPRSFRRSPPLSCPMVGFACPVTPAMNGQTLLGLGAQGLLVLFIQRADGSVNANPRASDRLEQGQILYVAREDNDYPRIRSYGESP